MFFLHEESEVLIQVHSNWNREAAMPFSPVFRVIFLKSRHWCFRRFSEQLRHSWIFGVPLRIWPIYCVSIGRLPRKLGCSCSRLFPWFLENDDQTWVLGVLHVRAKPMDLCLFLDPVTASRCQDPTCTDDRHCMMFYSLLISYMFVYIYDYIWLYMYTNYYNYNIYNIIFTWWR